MKSNIDIDRKYKDRDINKESVVLDIGGFKGEWAFHISKKYGNKGLPSNTISVDFSGSTKSRNMLT